MKKLLISTALILLSAITVFGQTCEWAEKIGGKGVDEINCIVTDNNGNIYVAGESNSDTIIFNNGKFLINSGNGDIFIAKYKSDGTCLWAENIGGKGNYEALAKSIALDSLGNIYVSGYYNSDTLIFNNTIFLTKSGKRDCFISKYNNNGDCIWAEKISGINEERSYSLAVDLNGNIFVAGSFESDTLIFNNGKYLTNNSEYGIFIAKYNNTGTCQWVEKIHGLSFSFGSIAVDTKGNMYISGHFDFNVLNFNNNITLQQSDYSISGFIAKYNNGGICQWAEKIGGIGYDIWSSCETTAYSIALDLDGYIYVSGKAYNDTLYFNNNITLLLNSYLSIYIAKYSENGICQWADQINGGEIAYIALDSRGYIYLAGEYYKDSLKFSNGISIKSSGDYDCFVASLTKNGTCQWVEKIAGSNFEELNGLSINGQGEMYIAGLFFSDTLFLNNDKSLKTYGYSDGFIAKYSQSNTSISDKPILNNIAVSPNPATDYIEIQPSEGSDILIINTLGEIVLSVEQTPPSVHRINVSNLVPGMYFIKIGDRVEKFIKI